MSLFFRIDRITLALSICWAAYFFAIGQAATAPAMLLLWCIYRAIVCVIDVFYTFAVKRPLVRRRKGRSVEPEATILASIDQDDLNMIMSRGHLIGRVDSTGRKGTGSRSLSGENVGFGDFSGVK